jgi:hypothetical protein
MEGISRLVRVLKNSEKIDRLLLNSSIDSYHNILISNREMSYSAMLDLMQNNNKGKQYFILSEKENILLTSGDKNLQGSMYYNETDYKLSQGLYKRLKRIFDVMYSLYVIIRIPFRKANNQVNSENIFSVLKGKKSWVGYSKMEINLPFIKEGVFNTQSLIDNHDIYPIIENESTADKYYAKHYSILLDYKICSER